MLRRINIRPQWLGGCALLVILAALTFPAAADGPKEGVQLAASGPVASRPDDEAAVPWAMGDVKAALQAANVAWGQARVVAEIATGKESLKAEGFNLAIAGDQVKVTGADASGAMYGLLELAEQIRNGGAQGDWKKVVATLSATNQEPAVQVRASNPFIHTNPRLLLDDVEMWKRYIDMLARNRFNVLDLHGGYDYKSGFSFPNLYPLLVQVKEYPAVGKAEQQQKNLKNFRAIAAHAHARGLKVAFMNYEAGGNGAPTSQLADYTAKAVTTLLREMPELDMLGFRVGESGQNAGFFQESYLKGFTDSGRKDVRLYSRSWLTTQAALEAIGRASGNGFDIEIKYNGEQLDLPYHAIQAGGGSYSYEGYIRNEAPYQIIWQVRADGTHRFWAWEDTDFIRRCVGTFALGQARGFSLEPSFSYYPTYAALYYARPEDQKAHDYIWEKHWMNFFAWGRLSYNPQLPEATILAEFQHRFGPAGKDIYQSMQTSGKIVPLVLAYRYMGPDHTQHSPETEIGYTGNLKKGATQPDALEFANNSPMDSRNFVGIRAFVANKIAGKPDGRIGPEHVAALLTQAAAETRKTIDTIQIPPGHAADEWRLLKTDLLAAAALGEYYAARIRGTMHLEYAMKAGCEADYQLALKLLAESRAAWKTLAETTDTVYAPLNNPLRGQRNFLWGSLLNKLETIDAAIPADFPRKPDAQPLTLTPAEKGHETGIGVSDVRHAIDPASTVKITCKIASTTPVKSVLLWHKQLPSGAGWQHTTMAGQGEFSAAVPLTAAGLMYQIEVQDEFGAATLFPPVLKSTPYRVITPCDLKDITFPKVMPSAQKAKDKDKPASMPDSGANVRRLRFAVTDQKGAVAWQDEARRKLFEVLKLDDLVKADLGDGDGKPQIDFKVEVKGVKKPAGEQKFTRYDLEISSTETRRIPVVLTVPAGDGKFPAVVCIHGHGGSRNIVYDPGSIYKGFALELANRGYVTIATEVGQHGPAGWIMNTGGARGDAKMLELNRGLMHDRLWDLMRCVSYLTTRPEVDDKRIGCAGLSLGGEMAMLLGAADPRVQATVASGGLSTVDTMSRVGCCICWDFAGLQENFDWPDFYCMMAPRWVMAQNGEKDECGTFFPAMARPVYEKEILPCYRLFDKPERAVLRAHPGNHVFEASTAIPFLDKALKPAPAGGDKEP